MPFCARLPMPLTMAFALLVGHGFASNAVLAGGPEAHFRLPGGVELVVAEPTKEGSTGFALAWPLGFADDPPELPGAAWALAEGLWRGGERPLGPALENMGGSGQPEVASHHTVLSGVLPAEVAPTFVGRLGEALAAAAALGPASPNPNLAASALGALAADPMGVAQVVGRGLALGPAYGRPSMALPHQWGAWSSVALAPTARRAFAPAGLRLALAGGTPPDRLVGPAVRAFAPLAQALPAPSLPPRPPGPAAAWRAPGGKAIEVVAFPGPGLANAPSDAAALSVAARILAKRLPGSLREVPGQPTLLLSQYEASGHNGALVVAATSLPGQSVATLEALQDALDGLVKGPIALDEWASAQRAEAEGAEAQVRLPRGRATALALGLVQAKRPGWDDAYPAVVRGLSRSSVASTVQAYLGADGRRATTLTP